MRNRILALATVLFLVQPGRRRHCDRDPDFACLKSSMTSESERRTVSPGIATTEAEIGHAAGRTLSDWPACKPASVSLTPSAAGRLPWPGTAAA